MYTCGIIVHQWMNIMTIRKYSNIWKKKLNAKDYKSRAADKTAQFYNKNMHSINKFLKNTFGYKTIGAFIHKWPTKA